MKVVLTLKFMSLGCTMVTLRSETLLYMSTPQRPAEADIAVTTQRLSGAAFADELMKNIDLKLKQPEEDEERGGEDGRGGRGGREAKEEEEEALLKMRQ